MADISQALVELFTSDLFKGGVIGSITFLFGILVKHYISMKEEMIKREFDIRREEKKFFMELYGHISITTDLVNGLKRALTSGTTRIAKEDGFKETEISEIVSLFQESYLAYSKFVFSSRSRGFEVFYSPKFAEKIAMFSGQLDAVYENHEISDSVHTLFDKNATDITKKIESMLGV